MADEFFPTQISGNLDDNGVDNPIVVSLSDGTTQVTVDPTTNGLLVDIADDSWLVGEAALDPAATAALVAFDDGTNSVFAQANAAGDLKVSLDDEVVTISADGNPNSPANPIFVQSTTGAAAGTEVKDYDQAGSVASGASVNHDYSVVGSSMKLAQVILSSSGSSKFELQTGEATALNTEAVFFIDSKGGTHCCTFTPNMNVPNGGQGTVRIIKTNRENKAQDLYSTILGNDIA